MDNERDERRLLLLHGFLVRRDFWDPLTAELAGDVRVIAPDLPGYGRAWRGMGSYRLDDVVDALVPLVEAEQPTHVLGHSMGGIVALALAARLPGRFERVGVAGLPVYATREEGIAHLRQRGRLRVALLNRHGFTHSGCVAVHRTRRLWMPVARRISWRHAGTMASGAFDHTRESHGEALETIIFAGHVEGLAAQVTAPVEALHGGRDGAAPVGAVREVAARYGWRLKVAPTGHHQLCVSRPGLTAEWVRTHLLEPVEAAAGLAGSHIGTSSAL